MLRHALGQRQQPLEVVGLLEYHRGLAGPQRHVDGVIEQFRETARVVEIKFQNGTSGNCCLLAAAISRIAS